MFRSQEGISEELGTAVTVQSMVFGNLDDRSGTGVVFTRDPATGASQPLGDYLVGAQGEDVVAGTLAAARVGAGRALVQAIEQNAQDRGIRLVRVQVPQASRLNSYFGIRGYLPIANINVNVEQESIPFLKLERRLPLLTVREQRRDDAKIIGELTGEDPWVFEMNQRPGAFVASDGDDVVGFVQSQDDGGGVATVTVPVMLPEYEGRGLDVWMVERAATYAETHGSHSVKLLATTSMDRVGRLLEDRGWSRDGFGPDAVYIRRSTAIPDNFTSRPS